MDEEEKEEILHHARFLSFNAAEKAVRSWVNQCFKSAEGTCDKEEKERRYRFAHYSEDVQRQMENSMVEHRDKFYECAKARKEREKDAVS